MNRTLAFVLTALALGLIALVVKVPTSVVSNPVIVSVPPPPPQMGGLGALLTPPPVETPPVQTPTSVPGSLSLTGKLSHPYLAPGSSDVFLTLDVSAVDVPGAERAPVNMALVIDRSGSMSGSKLQRAREAALRLIQSLGERDRLAIVHYGSDVKVLGSMYATYENKQQMERTVRRMIDDGGTNISAGLQAGHQQLKAALSDFKVNRLVLLSDGQPTEGIQSTRGLTNLVANLKAQGVSVTSLGIGTDFNEDLMQQLAEVGGGSYAYVRDASVLAAVIQRDLQQAGTMVARGVTLSMQLPDGVVLQDVLGRPSQVNGRTVTVPLPDFAARQNEKVVVQLRAQVPSTDGVALDVGSFSLDYRDVLADRAADSKLTLAALVTTDRSLADARRDKAATVIATRAQVAVNTRRAAEALEQGRYREAQGFMEKNKAVITASQPVTGAEMDADLEQNQRTYGLIQAAPASPAPARSDAVKAMKVDSLRGSGRGESVY